jgi:membrane protease subunit (stomatin/prohibitin family)
VNPYVNTKYDATNSDLPSMTTFKDWKNIFWAK